MCLQYILDLSTPPFLLFPAPLRTISTGFILLSSYTDTKHSHHMHSFLPSLCLPYSRWYPPLEKIYFSLTPFFFFF
jgi:hypothetical protein